MNSYTDFIMNCVESDSINTCHLIDMKCLEHSSINEWATDIMSEEDGFDAVRKTYSYAYYLYYTGKDGKTINDFIAALDLQNVHINVLGALISLLEHPYSGNQGLIDDIKSIVNLRGKSAELDIETINALLCK